MEQLQYLDAAFGAQEAFIGSIGYYDENGFRALRVDVSAVLAQYPDAAFTVTVQREGDRHPYRKAEEDVYLESEKLTVVFRRIDYARPGRVRLQVSFSAGAVTGKSCVYLALAENSLVSGTDDPDSPYADTLARMEAAVQKMEAWMASGGGISQEAVEKAVGNYLKENPPEETDPTVPSWAKAEEKPAYTPAEVGAIGASGRQVASANLALGAVTTGILADQAVTAEKIAAGVIPDAYTKAEMDAALGSYIMDIDALVGGDA